MEKLKYFYAKSQNFIENSIFVIILAFYPLVKINQGLDMADTSYSLTNFQYFPSAKGTWMVATYLANAFGWILMQLPRGNTLLGMYFYSGLIISGLALVFYFFLRKKIPAWLVFAGEILAIGLCWCPTTVLYNYLTYCLMGGGVLLLYCGIFKKTGKSKVCYFVLAGICLGANVAVRMPNIVQASFILALWYAAWLQKETFRQALRDTLACIAGYVIGFGIPFLAICIQYGGSAYYDMVRSLFAMTDKAADYKPAAMLTGMFEGYLQGLYWLVFAALCAVGLYVLFYIFSFLKKACLPQIWDGVYRILCIAVWCVLIRFYWGRGMFDFRYYYYGSMYQWGVFFLLLTIVCALSLIIGKKCSAENKVLALLVLLEVFITPIGGNNDLYPAMNNLFFAAPFTLWVCAGWFLRAGKKRVHMPWQSMLAVLGLMILIQSVGFHMQFVFSDGVWGEKRDTRLTGNSKIEGIYTNRENAELFYDLLQYAEKRQFTGKEVILYGEIPGLSYFLDMPAAITSAWPDLDSYRLVEFERDMERVEQNIEQDRPVVIVAAGIAAYKGEDAEAYAWFGVDTESYDADEKLGILLEFLDDYGYEETFCNMRYAVYE